MAKWESKKYPDGCLVCGTTEKTHLGRGLCSTCYQREANSVEHSETEREGRRIEYSSNDFDRELDRRSLVEDSEPTEESSLGSSERRPGSSRLSSDASSQDDAPERPKGIRGLFAKREKPVQEVIRPTKEKPPRGRLPKRQSASDTIEDVWSGVGALAARTGKHQPLGRYMQFSAGVSAEIIDEAVQGTIIDKVVLQPVVKGRGRFDALGAVFGPPALILAIENDPSKAPVLIPILKSSIRNSLPMMAKAIKKVQAKEAAQAAAARELFPDLAEGEDPADAIIAMLFEGWTPPAPVVKEEEPEPMKEEESVA